MSIAQAGVFLPFKTLLEGAGMLIVETPTTITIGTTGAGPGGGDMLKSEYATNGVHGVVDNALVAQGLTSGATVPFATAAGSVPYSGVTGLPAAFPSSWTLVASKPATFPPSPHETTHLPGGTDTLPPASATSAGLLAQLSGKSTDYVGGDNQCHAVVSPDDGDLIPPTSPTAFDDEFTAPTLNPKWTISGTKALVTEALTGGTFLQLAYAYGASGIVTLRATETVVCASGFGFQVKVKPVLAPYGSGAGWANVGFGLMAGTHSIGVVVSAQSATPTLSPTSYYEMFQIFKGAAMATVVANSPAIFAGTDLRFKIANDGGGANLSIYVSTDAINWLLVYQEAFSNGGSLNGNYPTSLILDVDSGAESTQSQGAAMGAFDYVRKIS